MLDELRSEPGLAWQIAPAGPELDQVEDRDGRTCDTAAVAVARATGRELWPTIIGVLPDDSARQVAYLSFVVGLAPREIASSHPERFPTLGDVYRVKRNVLIRLQRSQAVCALLTA